MNIEYKKCFYIILLLILITDLVILLNIPFLRQLLGFLLLTALPGLLILQILKLNKMDFLEKFILTWGLSISFIIFFGLLINNLSLSFGYLTPLSTIPLLISFNFIFILLAIIGYKLNKGENLTSSALNFSLTTSEKAFLIAPVIFPALTISGMHLMNTTDNNAVLLILLFSIPIYVAFVCIFNHKFPKRLYPVVIFLISISLLLLVSLRSNYIIGIDAHGEYDLFRKTLSNLHWSILGTSAFDACLSISLLPSIYQSFLSLNTIYFHKIFYSLLFSVTPLIVFVISKKYVAEPYAFLASFFFMSQRIFLYTAYSPRTNTAILFFALAIMAFLSDEVDTLKKRILFIVFMASCIVSHYSTTYIFFFIMLFCWLSIETLSKFSKKTASKKSVSLTIVLLFFAIIFFWYSQVTEAAFNAGLNFVEQTFMNLHNFFIMESRCGRTEQILGTGIAERQTPFRIEFAFTWLTFAFIGIGVISMLKKYKEMVAIPGMKHLKPDFLKTKFSIEYLLLTLACAGMLAIMVALPFVSQGYDLQRLYSQVAVVLSVVFVLGGIILQKYLDQAFAVIRSKGKALKENTSHNHFRKYFFFLFLVKFFTKPLQGLRGRGAEPHKGKKVVDKTFFSNGRFDGKNTSQQTFKKSLTSKSVGRENALQVRAYLIILLVLIPYFMCTTGTMYRIFDVPREITLNSEGVQYNASYIHDQGSYGAKWLGKIYAEQNSPRIYTDYYGAIRLISQGEISPNIDQWSLVEHKKIAGYIYLRYYNVVDEKLMDGSGMEYNMTEYSDIFIERNRIYNNGGSEVWR